MTLTLGSLFTGIGGMDLGLEDAGMELAYQVELDEKCRRVLRRHWPKTLRFHDIRDVQAFPSVDVLAGGFPCQDVSQANNNSAGVAGAKSGLWREFFRAIEQVRPKYAIIENAEALRYAGRGFDIILNNLASIGYDATWRLLRASEFGAGHHRARMWVVAYPHQEGQPAFTLDDEASILPQLEEARAQWSDPSPALRMADGASRRLDHTRRQQCGNGAVPLVAEYVGRCIINHYQRAGAR